MPRSPRRSRSPEPSRKPGYKSSLRSPSPPRTDRYSTSRRDDRSGRYDDRDRVRDRERDRDRVRDRPRERRDDYRPRDDDRRRDDRRRDDDRPRDDRRREDDRLRDDRRKPESSHQSPPRSPRVDSPQTKHSVSTPLGSGSPITSPGPQSEEEKQRLKKERLEAWKKARELAKGKENKTSTPEPDHKPSPPPATSTPAKSGLPARPNAFSFNAALSRIGLPMKPTPLKRSVVLDEEDAPDRKLQKLDLPEVNPEVQSGVAAKVEAISADLDVVDGNDEDNEDDVLPEVNRDDIKPVVKEEKMEVEEEEEDPLEAFMRNNIREVKNVNKADASRLGIAAADHEDEEEQEVKNKMEEELASKEALLALAASKSRKKDLPTPDHSKIDYEPFRKAFYTAPVEVQEMDEEETELLRLEMDGIKIRGQDAPKPVKNWGAFGLPSGCIDVIKRNEWTTPTSIQAQAIPAIMSGRDVIGVAKTGSGKTIAFTLPLLRHIKDQRPVSGGDGPISIIMSPTRELAMQIYKEAKPFLKVLNLRGVACYGGSPISEDIASMKKGAELVVCTPGRMIDLLTANNGRVTNLRRVTYLVLDEADRMFDMGFEPQVMKIINNIRPDAQKVLFSATFPKTMDALARKILVKPLEITVGGRSVVAPEIDQRVEVRDADTKFTRLLEILGEMSQEEEEDLRALIFVDRQEAADDLFRELLQKGYVCASLHGGKDQVDRDEAITNFKNGDVPIIVATSVAARGLDVKELKVVINYDAPNHMEDYVHRAGRTGRAGNKGVCVTFITPDQEKFSVDIVRAMEASKAFVPPELQEMSTNFLAKIKSGKARAAASGYAGKGLERIERRRDERDRAEKTTYGDTSEALSLSSREGAVIPYKPKGSEPTRASETSLKGDADYTFTEIKVEVVHGPAPDKITPIVGPSKGSKVILPASTVAALEKAKAEGRHVDAARLAKVVASLTQSIEMTKAEKLGAAIAPETMRKTKDPDATDYHAIFPINDYPQKARWKATNKEQMTLMAEISGASITNKGIFYPPGEEPGPGQEPKLHLLIESNDEFRVRAAVDELRRVLVEASLGALNSADRAGASGGRYAV